MRFLTVATVLGFLTIGTVARAGLPNAAGYLSPGPGRKIAYRIWNPKPGKPTLLLINGLIYDLKNWDSFIQLCEKEGYGIISFAFSAQPESLRALHGHTPAFLDTGLSLNDLTDEIGEVEQEARSRGAVTGKVELVTLSFGSIGAEFAVRHPELVDQVILMAPLVVPSDHYDPDGQLLHFWMDGWRDAARWVDPFGLWSGAWYDYAWNVIYDAYLHDRMSKKEAADPNYIPEGISPEVFKKSVFHLVRATRDFDLKKVASTGKLPETHLMLASSEEKAPLLDQLAVWETLPLGDRGSLVLFNGAYHALVGAHPLESADWLDQILKSKGFDPRANTFLYEVGSQLRRVVAIPYAKLKQAVERK